VARVRAISLGVARFSESTAADLRRRGSSQALKIVYLGEGRKKRFAQSGRCVDVQSHPCMAQF
jgi:hypothetical protein